MVVALGHHIDQDIWDIVVDQDIWDIDVDLELIAFFAILTFLTKKLASTPSGVASVDGHLLFLD